MALATGTSFPSEPRYLVKRQRVPSRPDGGSDATGTDAAAPEGGGPVWPPPEEQADRTMTAVSAATGPMAPPRRRVGTDVLPSGRIHQPVDRRAAQIVASDPSGVQTTPQERPDSMSGRGPDHELRGLAALATRV